MLSLIYEKPRHGMSYTKIKQSLKTQGITPKGFSIVNLSPILSHLLCPRNSKVNSIVKTIVKSSHSTLTSLSSISRP